MCTVNYFGLVCERVYVVVGMVECATIKWMCVVLVCELLGY